MTFNMSILNILLVIWIKQNYARVTVLMICWPVFRTVLNLRLNQINVHLNVLEKKSNALTVSISFRLSYLQYIEHAHVMLIVSKAVLVALI